MPRIRAPRETLRTTMAYVVSNDPWNDRVYRVSVTGRCNCDGALRSRTCKHADSLARAIQGALEHGAWECDHDVVMTPWAAEDLGLTGTTGLRVRPTP